MAGSEPRVVLVRHPGLAAGPGRLNPRAAIALFDRLFAALTGKTKARAAYQSLFDPGQTIGVKLNTLAGRGLAPHPDLCRALAGWLTKAGHPAKKIIFYDRTAREMVQAGFRIVTSGPGPYYFSTDVLSGGGYEDKPSLYGQVGSCFSRVLTRHTSVLISFGVLKDHDLAGVSICLKNLFGLIHNPNRYHDSQCDPYVAHVAAHPLVRPKLRLCLSDALVAQYHGGPARNPTYQAPLGGLMGSLDPVALDAVGAEIIEGYRRRKGLPSLAEEDRSPRWLATARDEGLGQSDPARIKVVRLEAEGGKG